MERSDYIALFALLTSVVSALMSLYLAIRYGDLAAVAAERKHKEEDTLEDRKATFQSLLYEVTRIRKAVDSNGSNERLEKAHLANSITRLPTKAFERAFVYGRPGLTASLPLIEAVTKYLALADISNGIIEQYHSATTIQEGEVKQFRNNLIYKLVQQTKLFPELLDDLEILLKQEVQEIGKELEKIKTKR